MKYEEIKYRKYDKDIIIIYIKQFTLNPEEFEAFESHIKDVNEDDTTKIIIVPSDITEKVERL